MARYKDLEWRLPDNNTWDHVKIALLMDIRDEMKMLNRRIDQIRRNTAPKRKKKTSKR